VQESSAVGGKIVVGDLDWYVAADCFSPFLREPAATLVREETPFEMVDREVLEAVASGRLRLSDEVTRLCEEAIRKREERYANLLMPNEQLMAQLREHYAAKVPESGVPGPLDDSELIRWAANDLLKAERPIERPHRWSQELERLLEHAAQAVGVPRVSPRGVRNGLIAAQVRDWGWSEDRFCHREWDVPASTVDDAIAQLHRSASHGSRSEVATFREKYVWAAVNRLAGVLADRLPIWDERSKQWKRLDKFSGLGTGMPDPLPRTAGYTDLHFTEAGRLWRPSDVSLELFTEEQDLVQRAQRWLTQGSACHPNVLLFGRGIAGFSQQTIGTALS
jgi:hypothetical protein